MSLQLDRLNALLRSRQFYELMQAYRFAAPSQPGAVIDAYDAVKNALRSAVAGVAPKRQTPPKDAA